MTVPAGWREIWKSADGQSGGDRFCHHHNFFVCPLGSPREPSEAGRVGKGGARERNAVFAAGGNGVERTLRRRADTGGGLKNRERSGRVYRGLGAVSHQQARFGYIPKHCLPTMVTAPINGGR